MRRWLRLAVLAGVLGLGVVLVPAITRPSPVAVTTQGALHRSPLPNTCAGSPRCVPVVPSGAANPELWLGSTALVLGALLLALSRQTLRPPARTERLADGAPSFVFRPPQAGAIA